MASIIQYIVYIIETVCKNISNHIEDFSNHIEENIYVYHPLLIDIEHTGKSISLYKLFSGCICCCNLLVVISSEYLLYVIYKDYPSFIDRITYRLSSLNILYVKIFQAFALNNSLIDEQVNNKLIQFTDNAPYTKSDINLSDLLNVANAFDLTVIEQPINSGMISLVFKAYTKDGSPMIIKMKRKNIDLILKEAIDNLLFFVQFLSFIPIFHKYQIANVITKNIDIIRHQTNFLEEVENMQKIKHNCKHLNYIQIPHSIKEVTEQYPNCILMEYIEGIKLQQINPNDYYGFARQIIKFGFVTTIMHGISHGDLHCGNILFIKDDTVNAKYPYKLGIIDFGIIYEIDAEYKKIIFEVVSQLFTVTPKESATKLLNLVLDPPDILQKISSEHRSNIINFSAGILEDTINNSKKVNQLQLYKFISTLKEYLESSNLEQLGIKPSDNFVKTQLVLAMSHGVTLTLCNDDFIGMVDSVINELFHTNLLL
jgi:ubiquinone biosynthesis protein